MGGVLRVEQGKGRGEAGAGAGAGWERQATHAWQPFSHYFVNNFKLNGKCLCFASAIACCTLFNLYFNHLQSPS